MITIKNVQKFFKIFNLILLSKLYLIVNKFDDIFKSKNNSSADKEEQLVDAHSTTIPSQMENQSNDEDKKKS